jgi:hypothetical protein
MVFVTPGLGATCMSTVGGGIWGLDWSGRAGCCWTGVCGPRDVGGIVCAPPGPRFWGGGCCTGCCSAPLGPRAAGAVFPLGFGPREGPPCAAGVFLAVRAPIDALDGLAASIAFGASSAEVSSICASEISTPSNRFPSNSSSNSPAIVSFRCSVRVLKTAFDLAGVWCCSFFTVEAASAGGSA